MSFRSLVLLLLSVLVPSVTLPANAQQPTPADAPAAPAGLAADPRAGVDRPSIVVAANSGEATVRAQLRGLDGDLKDADLEAGTPVVSQQPGLQVRPSVKLVRAEAVKAGESLVTLTMLGLVAFGERTR